VSYTNKSFYLNDMENVEEPVLWVFGYGSLLWKPEFSFSSKHVGHIRGFTRRFNQGNETFRGRPGKPGRVANLEQQEGSKVWGVAYEVKGHEDVAAALDALYTREATNGGYTSLMTPFFPRGDHTENGPEFTSVPSKQNGLVLKNIHDVVEVKASSKEMSLHSEKVFDFVPGRETALEELSFDHDDDSNSWSSDSYGSSVSSSIQSNMSIDSNYQVSTPMQSKTSASSDFRRSTLIKQHSSSSLLNSYGSDSSRSNSDVSSEYGSFNEKYSFSQLQFETDDEQMQSRDSTDTGFPGDDTEDSIDISEYVRFSESKPHMASFQRKYQTTSDSTIHALVFTVTHDNDLYLGPSDITTLAREIAGASGFAGTNVEYVTKMADFIREFIPEEEDSHLFELDRQVKFEVSKRQASIASL